MRDRWMSKVSEAEIKPCRVTPIHRHCCYTHTHTHQLKYTFVHGGEEVDGVGERLSERWISCLDVG